jgi:pimeloyl-ACP methyl ester carboxylesterase
LFRGLFHAWEHYLAVQDDPERRVLPFDWGARFLGDGTLSDEAARAFVHRHVEEALAGHTAYFCPAPVSDYHLENGELTFSSPLLTPYPDNNRAHGLFFPTRDRGPAVLVLPQWNAKGGAQVGLCRLLNRFGLSALRVTLPYHGPRMPEELIRADYMLSPNLGRTLQACRQAVWEARSAATWLLSQGYGPIGIVGTSLGSAIAFITLAHDPRIHAGVLNHISPYFADVVWRGISTRHVRQGLEGNIDLEELRKLWLPISPQSYFEHLLEARKDVLLIYARYDLSFPPDESRRVVDAFEKLGILHEKVVLPCGHYTTGKFPFNWMDGLAISRFLGKTLRPAG